VTPLEIVQAQFDAYNARDADAMCAWYAEDCIIANLNGEVTFRGREAVRTRYAKTFADNPQNRAWSHHRFAVGNVVVDHEQGERAPGVGRFEVVAIYTIRDGLIARLDMAR
jgi:uncharacterized protein (TIGR02246 family)